VTRVLDASLVSRLCHPGKRQYRPVARWIDGLLADRREPQRIVVPEIADFEVRRKLIHLVVRGQASERSLIRLDDLAVTLVYLPLNTGTMRRAADLWAMARLRGQPTAPEHALDSDVILAAQALEVSGTVVTMNPRHLRRYVAVESWIDIEAGLERP
jgi:predicted nucleic acid-binding protein